jgi:methionyl-tRNA formyltransferase
MPRFVTRRLYPQPRDFTQVFAAKALEFLTPSLQQHKIKIILSQKVGKVDDLPPEILALKKIENDGAKEKFLHLAQRLNAEIFYYENVNSEASLQEIKGFNSDLIISIRFGQIFKQPLIDLPKLGVINLHSALLPRYRGIMGTFFTILHGEKKIGTTLHYIDNAGIDTGPIIASSFTEVDYNSSLLKNIGNIYEAGCANVAACLEKIARGEKIETISQNELGVGGYFSYPKAEDVKKFLRIMPLFSGNAELQLGKHN